MPEATRTFTLRSPIQKVWAFLSAPEDLASCMLGFREFTPLDATASIWKLRLDLGSFTKLVELRARIDEMKAPRSAAFSLKGVSEDIKGEGRVVLDEAGPSETKVSFTLRLEAGGLAGPVANALISNGLPKHASEFVERMQRRLKPEG